jgi:large subunit ribosomal protein L23
MECAHGTLRTFRLTEKSGLLSSKNNCYTFEVDRNASKQQIACAVWQVFGVHPVLVRTLMQKGKLRRHRSTKRSRPVAIRRPAVRKAFVVLRSEDKIEIL